MAVFLRLYGLNWDQNQHLHPDERFLTMVAVAIKLPSNIFAYLDPLRSTASPYNQGFGFFVYGTFPLYFVKIVAEIFNKVDYGEIHFVGRAVSAFFDVGVVFLLYKIGEKIYGRKQGLLAAFLYSIMVLPIQLSHFFAVDTFLNFFLVLCFYFLILMLGARRLTLKTIMLGTAFGLALACKISAVYFSPIIALVFLYLLITQKPKSKVISSGLLFGVCTYLAFRLSQPIAFASGNLFDLIPNPQFVSNIKELASFSRPDTWFPPTLQWIKTKPLIFPLKNLIQWGLGLPLGMVSLIALGATVVSLLYSLRKKAKSPKACFRQFTTILMVLWVLELFFYQGLQLVKTMRYFLPIYPFLALLSAAFLIQTYERLKTKVPRFFPLATSCLTFTAFVIYPLSFVSIYTQPITRVTASNWIYDNVPSGSMILTEYWDDPLPLPLPTGHTNYKSEQLPLYDLDTQEKWIKIESLLNQADYIVLSSNRLYLPIMQNPQRYPKTAQYYQALFDGSLGFQKVAEFSSYPCFPPIKPHLFCFNDDSAEEAFTVYDHPKVMIFKKKI